jgi:hypothetical protein
MILLISKPSKYAKNERIPAKKRKINPRTGSGKAQNEAASDKLIHKKFYFMVA